MGDGFTFRVDRLLISWNQRHSSVSFMEDRF